MLTKVSKILDLVSSKLADLPDTVWKDQWFSTFRFSVAWKATIVGGIEISGKSAVSWLMREITL